MKIIHIITGLKDGGAENILYKICKHDIDNEHIVISLTSGDKYFSLLKKLGVKIYCMNMKSYSIFKFFDLIKLIHFLKPNVVQTWLIHGDFVGSIAARLAGMKNIVWNIVYSKLEIGSVKLITILLVKILAKLSYVLPKLIIVVSKSAKINCENLKYSKKKLRLVSSGYELSLLKPNIKQKLYFRKKIKIKKSLPLIGIVARYHPIKDHTNLFKALSIIKLKNVDFLCVLIGSDMNKKNKSVIAEIKKFQLNNYVKLLGKKNNIPQVMNGLDVNILCSKSEGFPNVIPEAMACGTPCVVTDVGDCALIVGNSGWVVPPKNPYKLAEAIEKAINEVNKKNWQKRCNLVRKRIKKKFDISKMILSYNKTWSEAYN